ncbi:MAG: ROK family protein [Schwartzia sp. (in: firmicutes)]
MANYAVFDIGGTAVKCAVTDGGGYVREKACFSNPARTDGVGAMIARIVRCVREYEAAYPLAGIGVATAGVVDRDTGTIPYDAMNIPGYRGTRLKAILSEATGLFVAVENDVNCAALGEYWLGAGAGASSLAMLTLGAGVGGALLVEGRIHHGAFGFAGEVGYLPLHGGSLEAQASTAALLRRVAEAKGLPVDAVDGEMVFAWAKAGDGIACRALEDWLEALAAGIAAVCCVMNPEMVIVGGGISAEAVYLRPRLLAALSAVLPAALFAGTRFDFARLGNDAGLLGALRVLRQRIEEGAADGAESD